MQDIQFIITVFPLFTKIKPANLHRKLNNAHVQLHFPFRFKPGACIKKKKTSCVATQQTQACSLPSQKANMTVDLHLYFSGGEDAGWRLNAACRLV